ncbi:MAG: protein archease [Thermoproteota archaeon]|nr:protein archease [Thermoproteota archaeon]
MSRKKAFEFLEHISDIYVAAYGETLEEAFENAALAMFETMTDTKNVEQKEEDFVEVRAVDEYALLYSWLEELLIKFEVNERLYSKFKIERIEKSKEGYVLRATIVGEQLDLGKHPSKVGIKAITYHLMEIIRGDNQITVKFLLDI